MKRVYTDADLKQILSANRKDSAVIDRKMQDAYGEIRRISKKNKVKAWKKVIGGFGAAAAAFILAVVFCAANPSLASEIPVLGSIFNKMQGIFTFGGIPQDEITYLQEEQDAGVDESESMDSRSSSSIGQMMLEQSVGAADIWETSDNTVQSRYQAADQGLTVMLTEYYASNQAVFIGVKVESDEAFPEMVTFAADPHYQLLQLYTTETYSFRDEADTVNGFRHLEGRLVDEHTFEGVMRIDYDSIRMDYRKYDAACAEADAKGELDTMMDADVRDDLITEYEVPDSFQMQLQINGFRGYVSTDVQEEEDYRVKGTWFIPDALDIRQSTENSAVIRIDETNAEGIGLEYIELSSVELTLHLIQNGDRLTVAVAFDKDGRRIQNGGTNFHALAIYGHDISVINVYVCDYDEYMDELKGIGLQQGDEVFREVLEERALYKKTIETTLYLQKK